MKMEFPLQFAYMPRGPTAGTSSGLRATSAHRGCPSRTAAPRGPRSRGAVPSIGIAAGTRIAQASAPPPAAAPGACAAALQNGCGNGPQHLAAALSRDAARHFIQLRAGSYIWHREKQSQWSPAPGARRRAPRSATPPRPFRQTAKSNCSAYRPRRASILLCVHPWKQKCKSLWTRTWCP